MKKKNTLIPHLLGDTHQGEAARCEGNTNAKTQGWHFTDSGALYPRTGMEQN
ncbi:lipoprotein [Proteus mirabilis]|uniref:Lipoprotein n=1 Tax=Proteus mirabilis TaxID=584 RepID=A0A379GIZ1_PROMI|nr:lipoprotein [Proteus mirabilis]